MKASHAGLLPWLLALVVGTWTGCTLSSNPSKDPPTTSQLSVTASRLSFGTLQNGSSRVLSETVSNVGSAAITVSQISVTGAGFSFSGTNPPITLSPGQAETFAVSFAPHSPGAVSGTLAIASNASDSAISVALSGTGADPGQLGLTPGTLSFGNVVVGGSATRSATLSASNGPVTVSSASMSSSEFSLNGISMPLTIPSGSSVPFGVTFSPQSSGSASATLSFTGSAQNTVTQTLTGAGTPSPQHSVTLNWNASTSSGVVGYNMYRGMISGGPYNQINSALETGTTGTDSAVISGQTYYYVVTAVDSSSQESSYSNEAFAVIPIP
jgi:Abnormal spindle-like microcephaly-assoc'd, ASPM-SPD-2-Hydin